MASVTQPNELGYPTIYQNENPAVFRIDGSMQQPNVIYSNPLPAAIEPVSSYDAAAAAAQAQALAAAQANLEAGRDMVLSSGRFGLRELGNTFDTGARGLVTTVKNSQQDIDMAREGNALNRVRSINDIASMIRQGTQSFGVRLSNMNALDSSAAEAAARAFGMFGNKQRGSVQNQFALAGRDLDVQQGRLEEQETEGARQLRTAKDLEVDRIEREIVNQLKILDAEAQGAGLTTRLAIDELKNDVISEGVQRLNSLDQWLTQQLATIDPMTPEEIEASAYQLNQAGATGSVPAYDYSTSPLIDQSGGNIGPGMVQLPLYTRRRET